MYDLPGMRLIGDDASPERPSSEVIPAYFARYERAFDLRAFRGRQLHTARGTRGRKRSPGGGNVTVP